MSALPIARSFGENLTPADYAALASRWITSELADQAGIRRVDSQTGRDMFSRRTGNLAGLIIPNTLPGDSHAREYRLRLDQPPLEYARDGSARETNKYLQPPGRRNLLYFPPGLQLSALMDPNLPVVVTEGEFKALALFRAANHESVALRFVPVAVAGVWNFRGTVGKTTDATGARRDVRGVIPDLDRIEWKGRRVIIAYDADVHTNPQVRAARWRLSSVLIDRGAVVASLEWPIDKGKGIDDHLATVGPDRVLAEIAAVEFGDWRSRLLRNDKGKLLSCYDNAALFLERSPEWAAVLGYNEFAAAHVILAQPPPPVNIAVGAEIDDDFDTGTVRWLERKGILVRPPMVFAVVDSVARHNSYHPVRDYLEPLVWDGTPRIGDWLIRYCGVNSSDADPNEYAMAIGEKFLISAVARIMKPGCKADHILILEGPQGIGKSTAVRTLASDQWFTDQLADMGSKDASMQLRGVWLVELSELDALNRSEMARAKAFLTQQTERFRLPYGRRVVQVPRQCCFVGTTNADVWLKDETGGRRFWPIRCGHIDLEGLARDRDELWAEAVHRYRAGATWWLDQDSIIKAAIAEQERRYDTDPWQPLIAAFVHNKHSVSIPEILDACLHKSSKDWTQTDKNRIARCLRAINWERHQIRTDAGREYRYQPAVVTTVTSLSPVVSPV